SLQRRTRPAGIPDPRPTSTKRGMEPGEEEPVARRFGAILVLEHAATPGGEEDAGAVSDAVRSLRAAGGDAEPLAPRTGVAGFDDPRTALTAATRLHLQAAAASVGLVLRAGLTVEDVLMTGEAETSAAAIDRAASLMRVASPGTTAVRADAVPALAPLDDAVAEPLDGPDVAPGTVVLVVPRWSAPVVSRRQLVLTLSGAVALGGAAWLVAKRFRGTPGGEVTLGVDPFRTSGEGPSLEWIGPALRDGLSTELSELSGARLYSQEFIDFLMAHEGLTPVEVANRLGIEKILSGNVVVAGDAVRVEVRIVEVRTGLVEAAYRASGNARDFLALENDIVLGVVRKLALVLSPDDERRLAARNATDLDARQRLLESEGAVGGGREAPPSGGHERDSWLLDRVGPRAAQADDTEAQILALLERYRRATEARDVAALAAMYVDLAPEH